MRKRRKGREREGRTRGLESRGGYTNARNHYLWYYRKTTYGF